MPAYYLSLINQDELVTTKTINELVSLKYLDIYLKKEVYEPLNNPNINNRVNYKWTIVNEDGDHSSYCFDQFEIVNILPDNDIKTTLVDGAGVYKTGREIIIRDNINSKLHKYRSNAVEDLKVLQELFFIINSLKKIKDWEVFMELASIPKLKEEIVYLKKLVTKLRGT